MCHRMDYFSEARGGGGGGGAFKLIYIALTVPLYFVLDSSSSADDVPAFNDSLDFDMSGTLVIEIIAQVLPTAQVGVVKGIAVTVDGGSDHKNLSEVTFHLTPIAPYKVGKGRRIHGESHKPALVSHVSYFKINNFNFN